MKLKHVLVAATLATGLGFVTTAPAATATNQFTAKITIVDSCDVQTTGIADMDFGSHTFADTNVAATTDITVKCSNGTAYDIGLSGSGSMTDGSSTIAYGLYSDVTHNTVWGSTVGTDTVADSGNGTDQVHTVYGLVPSIPATASPGAYSDLVTVTVTY